MNFKSILYPDVKTLTSLLRVRPSRDRVLAARGKDSHSIFSSKISNMNLRVTTWRVSPVTGQLEQRCIMADSEEPQSRFSPA
ncbi:MULTISPECIES: hypothetical protein [Rahnella]|uniref:Uncharacterized protein n=1 Tax=Rahnella laticis TaxID=2787622 RepID=A0ABS0E2M0_9GAMM|nr:MULTISPECIES: hypothetical protein [Rahnella]MBF7978919.1 hypothetical protein [Rahnella laticis]MBF7994851.1 hypothetical protein [Rahnella laticis]MBF7999009.1 hypothetical protein [Rahnella sp. LAC-M12]MBV6818077.1 hypothetical protein [Rahnella sp. PD12R]